MRLAKATGFGAVVMTALATMQPQPVAADPVTLNYLVTVDRVANNGPALAVMPFTFQLSMTYDDQPFVNVQLPPPPATSGFSRADFGPPTFSTVPYSGPFPGPGHDAEVGAATLELREFAAPDFTNHVARAYRFAAGPSGHWTLELTRRLSGSFHDATDIGVPTAASFLMAMVGGPLEFSYAGRVGRTDTAPFAGAFGYFGTARAIDAPAVPEPATIALVGSGLALLLRRRMQVRRKPGAAVGLKIT